MGVTSYFKACPDVCVENGREWVLFPHQVNEMNEKLSFKMGVIFTTSNYMGENCLDVLYNNCPKVLVLNYSQYKDKTN